jgi:transcriptional regulator with XRE-family HTH domain
MAGKPGASPRPARDDRGVREDVGQRLRAHREARSISLRELARRLGLSPSAISQIETGKSRPSVSTLYSIVSELGMSLDELFSGNAAPEEAPAARAPTKARRRRSAARSTSAGHPRVQRAGNRMAIDLESGVRWERLTAQPDPRVDFLYVTYEAGGSSNPSDLFMRHSGREYGLVLGGTLEVTVGFETYDLGPGDSICFDSTLPHRLRNTGTEPVYGIWLVIGRDADARALGFEEPAGGS